MPSLKPQLNTRVSEEVIKLAHELQDYYTRELGFPVSQADLLEKLIRERAKELGLRHYKPPQGSGQKSTKK